MRCLESQALAVASTQIAFDTLFDTLAGVVRPAVGIELAQI